MILIAHMGYRKAVAKGQAQPQSVPHAGLAHHELDLACVHRPGHLFPGSGCGHAHRPHRRAHLVRDPGARVWAHQVARAGAGMTGMRSRALVGDRPTASAKESTMHIPNFDDVKAAREQDPALHPSHARFDELVPKWADRRGPVLQVRELREGRRLQGEGRQQRGLRAIRGAGEEGCRNPLLGQPCAVPHLRCREEVPWAKVVMPRTAPEAKKAAVRGYGGTVIECEPSHRRA